MSDTEQETKPTHLVGVEGTPGAGPHMIIVLTVSETTITDAKFSTYGCPASFACGQWVTEQVIGKKVAEIEPLGESDIIAGIGQMPLGREHCPGLAIKALKNAVSSLLE